MLAINHTSLATSLVLGASLYLDVKFFLPLILLVVFSSLLPDIDHPKSEISNFLPFFNQLFPHRQITHSLLATSIFTLGIYFLLDLNQVFSILVILACIIGSLMFFKFSKQNIHKIQKLTRNFFSPKQIRLSLKILEIIILIFLILLIPISQNSRLSQEAWILLSFGYFTHLLGDLITKDGIPMFWPIKKRQALKLFKTGSGIEKLIGFALFILNLYLLYLFWNQFQLNTWSYWLDYLNPKDFYFSNLNFN